MSVVYLLMFLKISIVACENLTDNRCCPDGYLVFPKFNICKNEDNATVPSRLNCNSTIRLSKFSVSTQGNVVYRVHELHSVEFRHEQACVGNQSTRGKPPKLFKIAMVCVEDENDDPPMVEKKILGYCMIVSVVFLALVVIIYCALSELRDLMGKSIINFCGSQGIGLAILSIMKLMSFEDMNLCAVRGFLSYFFMIAAFFWMTAISIQILISTRQPAITDGGWREFLWYALFAWGFSIILTIIMAVVNFHPGTHSRPGIGLSHCWFFNKTQQWIYMYSVMSLLLVVNIGIFVYISTIVWRHTFASNHVKALKYKFTMTVRLIVLMGLPWVFEMISSISGKHVIWTIIDVFNTLQGILIFLLLVVFRKRAVKVMYRHGWLDCMSGIVELYLAAGDDDEGNAIQHTDVPMNDRTYVS